MKKSWKTSVGGILIALSPIVLIIGNCLLGDCDLSDLFQHLNNLWSAISVGFFSSGAVILGVNARDRKVRSEEELEA